MNISGLSDRINGLKLKRTVQVRISECTHWPFNGMATLASFLIINVIEVSPGQNKVAAITR